MIARLFTVIRASRLELGIWVAALLLYTPVVLLMVVALRDGPVPPGAAEEAEAFRADYLSPGRIFQAGLLAPLIETWLIVKGMDALKSFRLRADVALLMVALVAAGMHYPVRGTFSALYNAGFFALMASIYAKCAYENEKRGENRPASILLILLMHMANNAVALGMIWLSSTVP